MSQETWQTSINITVTMYTVGETLTERTTEYSLSHTENLGLEDSVSLFRKSAENLARLLRLGGKLPADGTLPITIARTVKQNTGRTNECEITNIERGRTRTPVEQMRSEPFPIGTEITDTFPERSRADDQKWLLTRRLLWRT